MESGSCYQFPPYEGRYSKFNDFEVQGCKKLPYQPSTDKVFLIHGTEKSSYNLDGFKWGFGNKSDKTFFGNIPNNQKALKYKCSVINCPAVKYVDIVLNYDVTRVYYDKNHEHSTVMKGKVTLLNSKPPPVKKSKLSLPKSSRKRSFIDDSDDDDFSRHFSTKTSTPLSSSREPVSKDLFDEEISGNERLDKAVNEETSFYENTAKANNSEILCVGRQQVNVLVNDNLELNLKIKLNLAHINLQRNKKKALTEKLMTQLKDIQRLQSENAMLEKSLHIGEVEVVDLQAKQNILHGKIEEAGSEKAFINLDEEIGILESMIEKRKSVNGCFSEEISILQQSLNIFSGSKKQVPQASIDSNQVSRDLLRDFDRIEGNSEEILSSPSVNMKCRSSSHTHSMGASNQVSITTCSLKSSLASLRSPATCLTRTSHQEPRSSSGPVPASSCCTVSSSKSAGSKLIPSSIPSSSCNVSSPQDSNSISNTVPLSSCNVSSSLLEETNLISSTILPSSCNVSSFPMERNFISSPIPSSSCNVISSSSVESNLFSSTILPSSCNVSSSSMGRTLILSSQTQASEMNHEACSQLLVDPFLDGKFSQQSKKDNPEDNFNDTLVHSVAENSQESANADDSSISNHDLDTSITFFNKQFPLDKDDVFDNALKTHKLSEDVQKSGPVSFKVTDDFWDDCEIEDGPVPYGHNGKGVFKLHLDERKRMAEIQEIHDGRDWCKKKVAVKSFDGCTDHLRYYQDCNGYRICPNENCSARKLFNKPSRNFIKKADKSNRVVKLCCSSCDAEMKHQTCLDITVQDKSGIHPKARRYLDFDQCHNTLIMKYVGTHTCLTPQKIAPMDETLVKQFFLENPSSTAARFKDYAIKKALHEGQDITEVSMQYADINKIRMIMMKQKKTMNPDGSGLGFLKKFGESLGTTAGDKYLLSVFEDPKMVLVSSSERMKVAAWLSNKENNTTESASVDFCESHFKDYSVMEVTTYSGELRQLVAMFSIVVKKPGENADNVCAALEKIDKMLLEHSGVKFEPKQWTTDNSGALENGIIRAKGISIKPFLASDKLHDIQNINRVVKSSVPLKLQGKLKEEIFKMINGNVPAISENIYQCLLNKAKSFNNQSLYRSLVFNYRKRHKYWYCYRLVVDNNATSEQINRVMTRHGKGEGLVDGVQRMVRTAINDKAKFSLAADGVMVNKGPTVQDRKVRVERALLKSLPEILSSIDQEENSQATPAMDEELKKKALEDFKPKTSDTHRSDKKRKSTKLKQGPPEKSYKKKELLKSKRSLKQVGLSLVSADVSDNEIIATFRRRIGLEETVTIVRDSVLCTCSEHDKNYFCPEILKIFQVLESEDLVDKLKFSSNEFSRLKEKAKTLMKEVGWEVVRCMNRVKCSSCKKFISAGCLTGTDGKNMFHPSEGCLRADLRQVAKVGCPLSQEDVKFLLKCGIRLN